MAGGAPFRWKLFFSAPLIRMNSRALPFSRCLREGGAVPLWMSDVAHARDLGEIFCPFPRAHARGYILG